MIATRFDRLALLTLCGWGVVQSASAQDFYPEGLYGWYEAGPAIVQDAKIRDFFGEPVTGNTVKFDTGFHFGIGIGRELTRYLRIEVESGFNYNAVKSIQ